MTVEQCWQRVPGGSGTYIVELCTALNQRPDVKVTGIAATHRHRPPTDVTPPVPVRHSILPRRSLYAGWNSLGLPLAGRSKVDVVHATTWAIPRTRRPLVVTAHDTAFLRSPEHFTPRGNKFFKRALERMGAEADLIIVPSEATLDDCLSAGLTQDRLRLVPHGVRHSTPTAADVLDFRRRFELTADYILWTGTREPRKNLRGLLAAFAEVAAREDVDLVLVGPAGWGDTGTGTIPPHVLPRVHLLGRITHADLQSAYAGARAFAFPSLWEGFGMPVLESMAHGTPVITSRDTSMAEITGETGILVDPENHDEIALAILRAIGPERDQLGVAARRRASEFSWTRAAEQTLDVYREAVERHQVSRQADGR
ncbi:MAG: glycosyltransferase family 4 protein [Cellulomonas sp.]